MDERDRDSDREEKHVEDTGHKGGSAEAYMTQAAAPVAEHLALPIGAVRWHATAAGVVIALAAMMFLNALGVGIGLAITRLGYGGGLVVS